MARERIPAAGTPIMYNKTLTTADVEETQTIEVVGESIKKIQIKSQSGDSLQYGWATTGPYTTIPADQTYYEGGLDIRTDLDIFLVGSVNGQVAEIEVWI